MIEVIVMIPIANNDGKPFSAADFLAFEDFATGIFGGVSRLPGETQGVWVDGGVRYDDRLVTYLVALPSIIDAGRLSGLIEFAKAHFEQEAIYIRYLGIAEIL